MLVAVDVVDPGDAGPEFGLGPYEGLQWGDRDIYVSDKAK